MWRNLSFVSSRPVTLNIKKTDKKEIEYPQLNEAILPINGKQPTVIATANLSLLRMYCGLSVILYPGWSVFLHFALPEEYDDPIGRILLGIFFGILGCFSYVSPFVRKHFTILMQLGFIVIATHFFWLAYRSNLSLVYVVGSLIVAICYSMAFIQRRPLLFYSLLLIVLAVVVSLTCSAPKIHKIMLVAGIITSQIVAIAGVSLHFKAIESLEKEKTVSLRLKQKLMERELEAAEAVQKTLLLGMPTIANIAMKAYYRSANQTGGDWFGHHHDKKNTALFLWIGDVTGHGFPSSLVTGVACGALYSGEKRIERLGIQCTLENRLVDMAQVVNEIICQMGGNMHMTMFFCAIDLQKQELVVLNAGHNFPYLIANGAEPEELVQRGDPLGFSISTQFETKRIGLKPGDSLFLYTDGLLENKNDRGKTLSHLRLKSTLKKNPHCHSAIDAVVKQTNTLWQNQSLQDDVTLLAFTWLTSNESKKAA